MLFPKGIFGLTGREKTFRRHRNNGTTNGVTGIVLIQEARVVRRNRQGKLA